MIRKLVVLLVGSVLIVSCAKKEPVKAPIQTERMVLDVKGWAFSRAESSDASVDLSTSLLARTVLLQTAMQNKLVYFECNAENGKVVWDTVNTDADFSDVKEIATKSGTDADNKWWGFSIAGGKVAVQVPNGSTAFVNEYQGDSARVETSSSAAQNKAVQDAVKGKYPDRKSGVVNGMAYLKDIRIEPDSKGFQLWFTYSVYVN